MIIKSQTQLCFPVTQQQNKSVFSTNKCPAFISSTAKHSTPWTAVRRIQGEGCPSLLVQRGLLLGNCGATLGKRQDSMTKISSSPQASAWGAGRSPLLQKHLGGGCHGATTAEAPASVPPTTLRVLAYAKHLLTSAHELLEYKQQDLTLLTCNFM